MLGKITREEEWAGLVLVALLAGLGVVGAFLGAGPARRVFSSPPVALLWLTAVGLLAARLVRLRLFRTSPGVFAACLGALLVLGGGLYGSEMGHRLTEQALGRSKVPIGRLLLVEGRESSQVTDRRLEHRIGILPFALRLENVLVEPSSPDETTQVPSSGATVVQTGCEVSVIDRGREVIRKVVVVNHPLHYGGYHFAHQQAGGPAGSRYAMLLVKSDSGLAMVYAGFGLVLAGVAWACLVQPMVVFLRKRHGD
jgi:hypothetical protein